MSRPKTRRTEASAAPDARPEATAPSASHDNDLEPSPDLCSYVCVTRSRCEKKFACLLASQRIECYLPLRTFERRHKKTGIRKLTEPLFRSYVFVRLEPMHEHILRRNRLLVRAIRVEDDALLLRQLAVVWRVLASGLEVSVYPLIVCGTRVRVASGPLRGVEGIVNDPATPSDIVVAVDLFQQGVLMHLHSADLRPLP